MARIRKDWTQAELAARAGVTPTTVSRLERGHLGSLDVDAIRAVAAVLDIRVELKPRARAIDLDRVVNARHAALAEFVIGWIGRFPGWVVRPEVSFSRFGERGVVDLLCWHAGARALLVIELKTEFVDFGELLAVLGMKHRLAPDVAAGFEWRPLLVASCLLVADSMTNRRRARDHQALLSAALPADGRELGRWLKEPAGSLRALRFVTDPRPGHVRSEFAGRTRVRPPRAAAPTHPSRSEPLPNRLAKGAVVAVGRGSRT